MQYHELQTRGSGFVSMFVIIKIVNLFQDYSVQSISIYNNHRPHLSCHMLTPVQMHQQQEVKLKSYNKKAQTSLVDV
jgi:hypothetical protein